MVEDRDEAFGTTMITPPSAPTQADPSPATLDRAMESGARYLPVRRLALCWYRWR